VKITRRQLKKLISETFHGKYGSEDRARDARAGGYDPNNPIPSKYWNASGDNEEISYAPQLDIMADHNPLQYKIDMLRKKFASNPDALQYLELGFDMIENVAPGLDPTDNETIHTLAQQVANATGFSKMMFLPIIRLSAQQ